MRYIILILLAVVPTLANAATYTSTQSGNWSASATWGGTDPSTFVPGTDTITVASGHAVTLDDSRTIPATTVEGSLTQSTGVTTTLGGALTVGNGLSKDGAFTFGAGATVAMGSNNVILNNCTLASNATAGSWAIIAGTGAIQTGAVYSAPKQNIQLTYISHQTTGAITYAAGGTSGTPTNLINVQHCTFTGTGAITFGLGGWTPATTSRVLDYNDFVDTGTITIAGLSTGSTVSTAKHCTFRRTSPGQSLIKPNLASAKTDFTGSVFVGAGFNGSQIGGLNLTGVFFTYPVGGLAGSGNVMSTVDANTYSGCYFYAPPSIVNPHVASFSGTNTVSGCVSEMYGATGLDGGNAFIFASAAGKTLTFSNNLMIGSGSAFTNVGAHAGSVNVVNNTFVATSFNSYERPITFWLSENGEVSGSVAIKSNLYVVSGGTANYFIRDNDANIQTITEQGYNNTYGTITTLNSGTSITTDLGNNISANPAFVSVSRKLATWNGNTTDTQSINQLLGINGYNSTSKTQADTPSGVTVDGLVSWVRAGFAPTNTALDGAGYGGTDIGAIPVVAGYAGVWGIGFGL